MTDYAYQDTSHPDDGGAPAVPAVGAEVRPVPRISIQAFCESPDVAAAIEAAAADRRMARAHVKIQTGGIVAAAEFYQGAATPNLIVVESKLPRERLDAELERLSQVCDAGTKVVIIGHVNDVDLYRSLAQRGVSEYLVTPVDFAGIIKTVANLYVERSTRPLGRTIAFIGGKGGVGSSMVAHNVAWSVARSFENDVVVADLDLAFGTAGLDFNQDPAQGIAEAVGAPDRLDDNFLDRLLARCSDHLSLLAAPATLDRTYDFTE
ncbi:MAG: CtpF protein, partial [Bauldia sp.]|nr:CtpF protein [Bauldia sp.]